MYWITCERNRLRKDYYCTFRVYCTFRFFFRTLESERFSFSKQSTEPIDKFLRSITLGNLGWKWKCITESASSCLHAHPMHQRPRGGLEPPTCSGMALRSDYLIVITGRVCQSTVGFNCDELQALLRRRSVEFNRDRRAIAVPQSNLADLAP